MKRRNFILIGSASIAAVLVPTAYYYLKDIKFDKTLAQPQFLSMIWDTSMISTIGNKYRLQVPNEKKERSLVKLLFANTSSGIDTSTLSIGQKIKKDFETGNTVMVDGWILSVTEVRQCALFSTIASK